MTREEAVKKAEQCFTFNHPGQEWYFAPFRLVAALENLGMLTLDEPKSAKDRAMSALVKPNEFSEDVAKEILGLLDSAGLKIVEK